MRSNIINKYFKNSLNEYNIDTKDCLLVESSNIFILMDYNDIVTEGLISDTLSKVKTLLIKAFNKLCEIILKVLKKILDLFRIIKNKIKTLIKKAFGSKESFILATEYALGHLREDGKVISITQLNEDMDFIHSTRTTELRKLCMTTLNDRKTYTEKIDTGSLLRYDGLETNSKGVIQFPKAKELVAMKYKAAEEDGYLIDINDAYVERFHAWVDKNEETVQAMLKECHREIGNLQREISVYFKNARDNTKSVNQLTQEQQDILVYNRNVLFSAMCFNAEMVRAFEMVIDDNWEGIIAYHRNKRNGDI